MQNKKIHLLSSNSGKTLRRTVCYSGVGPEQTERHGSLLKSEGSPGLPGHGKFSPSLARTHKRSRGSLSLGERLFHRKSFMAAFAWSDYKLAPVIRRCLCGIHTVHLDGASLWCISVVHPCLTSRLWLVHSNSWIPTAPSATLVARLPDQPDMTLRPKALKSHNISHVDLANFSGIKSYYRVRCSSKASKKWFFFTKKFISLFRMPAKVVVAGSNRLNPGYYLKFTELDVCGRCLVQQLVEATSRLGSRWKSHRKSDKQNYSADNVNRSAKLTVLKRSGLSGFQSSSGPESSEFQNLGPKIWMLQYETLRISLRISQFTSELPIYATYKPIAAVSLSILAYILYNI